MLTILGTILIVLAAVVTGVLADRKWGVIPRREKLIEGGRRLALPGHGPGTAPATAIDVSPGELEALRRARCHACNGDTDALADDHVTHEERELIVIHAKCRRCGLVRGTYVFARG